MSEARALNLLKQGIASARAGEKSLARRYLKRSAELNPDNDAVWLWLAVVAESPTAQIDYLKHALKANPNNKRVKATLKQLQAKHQKKPSWKCPLCMAPADKPSNPCPTCGAVLSLSDIDALLNSNVDTGRIERSLQGYKRVLGQGVDFGVHINLALGHLNLGQVNHGVAHLQAALRAKPDDDALKSITSELLRRQAASAAANATNGQIVEEELSRGLILAVDDSPTIRKLVSMTLKRHDYDVELAEDGMEALGMLNNLDPDLILLDITMPRMDGYQVCKLIKSNNDTRHIPVVMLTGKDGFFDKVRGRLAGSTRYLTKPFDPAVLLQVVEKYALEYEEYEEGEAV